ncbi:MAG: hypothetical protein MUC91_11645 [Verrucomicrobia bacterium]|nr:hypothetical protein [Verrucomicrobiota bacterium]
MSTLAFLTVSGQSEAWKAGVMDRSFESAAGRRLGVAIATDIDSGKIANDSDRVVVGVLNLPSSATHTRDHAKAYLQGLMEGLNGAPVEVLPCQEQYNQQAQSLTFGEGGGVDMMTVIANAAKSIPDVDVFVTFAGLPSRADPKRFQGLPPIYAFQGEQTAAVAAYIRSGGVRGVVTFRENVDWVLKPDPAWTWEELFDQWYVFHSAEN